MYTYCRIRDVDVVPQIDPVDLKISMIDMIVGLRSDPCLIAPVTMLGLVDYSMYEVRFIETINSTRCFLDLDIEINQNHGYYRLIGRFFLQVIK